MTDAAGWLWTADAAGWLWTIDAVVTSIRLRFPTAEEVSIHAPP